MYSRLDRKKNPPDLKLLDKGGIIDLFDNAIKETFLITDKEYDHLVENATDEELELITIGELKFTKKRMLLKMLHKHLDNQ